MSLLVVGSVAYDTVTTPQNRTEEALGGSATYCTCAASYLTPVAMIAIVGNDFASHDIHLLEGRGIDMSGLQIVEGKTFRWSGEYSEDFRTRRSLQTHLNVFASFQPRLGEKHRSYPYLFLGNIDPDLQLAVLEQMRTRPRLVAADTMNYWIEGKGQALEKVVGKVDILFVDENEARQLAGVSNLIVAAKELRKRGPSTVVIKRGEHGATLFGADGIFALPAYPLECIVDPTGAGDSFAGGFMGYLAATDQLTASNYRRAAVVGSAIASYGVESFSVNRLNSLTRMDLEERFNAIVSISSFQPFSGEERLPWRAPVEVTT